MVEPFFLSMPAWLDCVLCVTEDAPILLLVKLYTFEFALNLRLGNTLFELLALS